MAPIKNVKTGKKDAKGRIIYRGPNGGLFVINASGTRARPAQREFMKMNNMLTNHVRRSYR
jgi:hypothetical protein